MTHNFLTNQNTNYLLCLQINFHQIKPKMAGNDMNKIHVSLLSHKKNSCDGIFSQKACSFIKNRLQHRCTPMNFAKFLKTVILKKTYEGLLLHIEYCTPANNTPEVVAVYRKTATKRGRNID